MVNERPVTLSELQDILDRCGPEPAAWPAERRAAAQALVAGSAEARQRLDAARALKDALGGPRVKAPAGLMERILKAAKDDDKQGG